MYDSGYGLCCSCFCGEVVLCRCYGSGFWFMIVLLFDCVLFVVLCSVFCFRDLDMVLACVGLACVGAVVYCVRESCVCVWCVVVVCVCVVVVCDVLTCEVLVWLLRLCLFMFAFVFCCMVKNKYVY